MNAERRNMIGHADDRKTSFSGKLIWGKGVVAMVAALLLLFTTISSGRRIPQTIVDVDERSMLWRSRKRALSSPTRGLAMCVGSKMVPDALAVLDQVRNIHNSTLPVAIIHCTELPLEDSARFHKQFNDVNVIDICEHGSMFGMHHSEMVARLRSWFCKAAAIVLAPFDEVMVVDLDTIWFEKPDDVFEYRGYRQSGALFVRDRMTHDHGRGFHEAIQNFIQTMNPNISITAELAASKVSQDGINFFWRGAADPRAPTYNNMADSSMIVVNRRTHPRLLAKISEFLPRFSLGWGDKEMYWITSIIAEEPYEFEPFLFTLYGPCGLIMHYHPNDYRRPEEARPLYVNAEWLVEKIKSVGHDLEFSMPNATLATPTTALVDISHLRGCACSHLGCRPMTARMNQIVLRVQWERFSRRLSRDPLKLIHIPRSLKPLPNRPDAVTYKLFNQAANKTEKWYIDMDLGEFLDAQNAVLVSIPCVPVFAPLMDLIADMNRWLIERNECGYLGCASYPFSRFPGFNPESFCIPISFNPAGPEPELAHFTVIAQIPPPLRHILDGSIIQGTASRSVYLVQNQTFREFPNGDTFLKMGYEWGQIRRIHQREVDSWPKGPSLPSL